MRVPDEPVFLLPAVGAGEESAHDHQGPSILRFAQLELRDAARARRHPALALRRDLRGAVSHPVLRLRVGRAGGSPLQGRGPGLHLFALLQPDHSHVRGAHAPDRGGGGRPRHRHRHGRRNLGAAVLPQGRRPHRRRAGHVRLVPLRGAGSLSPLRHHLHAGRRPRHGRMGPRRQAQHEGLLLRDAGQPDARPRRHRRRLGDRALSRRHRHRRQRVRHPADAEAAQARRRRRRLLDDQAHRRPGPVPRRRRAVLATSSSRTTCTPSCARPGRR